MTAVWRVCPLTAREREGESIANKPGCAFVLHFVWARHDYRPDPQRSPRLKQPRQNLVP